MLSVNILTLFAFYFWRLLPPLHATGISPPEGRFLGAGAASGAGGSAMEGAEKKYDARFAAGIILMRNIYMYVRINKLCFIYLACSLQ